MEKNANIRELMLPSYLVLKLYIPLVNLEVAALTGNFIIELVTWHKKNQQNESHIQAWERTMKKT